MPGRAFTADRAHTTAPRTLIAKSRSRSSSLRRRSSPSIAIPALATVSRPICKYPDKLVYNGTGSTNVASSFACKHESHDELMEEQKTLPDADVVEDRHDNHDRDN